MIKLKRIYLYYSECLDEYSMDVTMGDSNRDVTFKMDDKQTRKAIIPLLDAYFVASVQLSVGLLTMP